MQELNIWRIQKVYYGADTDKHGARLDVYLEEDDVASALLNASTIYDVEPNLLNDADVVVSLTKRVRFYHAKIDSTSLKSGESYRVLKNVIVIMITPYDPFGLGRMVDIIRNKCEEYLINKAIQKEKTNTELERKRAESAEARAQEMAAEILRLKEELLTRQTRI